jgi:hypothetical protein
MSNPRQAKTPKQKPKLSKQAVRVALVHRGWTQADLANAIGKSLTATNLAINHCTFPEIVTAIRKELRL